MDIDIALSCLIGVGLSAACGFRVFVPLLIAGFAAKSGHLQLSPGFEWIGDKAALISFGAATILEIGAYFIPWADNLMDAIAAPAAVIAGILLTASSIGDVSPFLRWTLAVIAGGGAAGAVKLGTSALRAASSFATGGLGNPAISAAEALLSVGLSLLAIVLPLLAIGLLVVVLLYGARKLTRVLT